MNNEQQERLLVRPHLKDDESLEGYVIRLAMENGFAYGECGIFQSFIKNHESSYRDLPSALSAVTGRESTYYAKNDLSQVPEDMPFTFRKRINETFFCTKHKVYLQNTCNNCGNEVSLKEVVYCICSKCKSTLVSKRGIQIGDKLASIFTKETKIVDGKRIFFGNFQSLDFSCLLYNFLKTLPYHYEKELGGSIRGYTPSY